jgi:hypothetical protein
VTGRRHDRLSVLERLGPKRAKEGAYVWQKLMRSGAVVGNQRFPPENRNILPKKASLKWA